MENIKLWFGAMIHESYCQILIQITRSCPGFGVRKTLVWSTASCSHPGRCLEHPWALTTGALHSSSRPIKKTAASSRLSSSRSVKTRTLNTLGVKNSGVRSRSRDQGAALFYPQPEPELYKIFSSGPEPEKHRRLRLL